MAGTSPLTLEALCTNYYASVLHYVQTLVKAPEDAEDITQDVFTRAVQAFPTFKPMAPGGWLRMIALNVVRDRRRHEKHVSWCSLSDDLDTLNVEDGLDLQTWVEDREQVQRLLSQLSCRQRTALLLSVAGYSSHEIADWMGTVSANACSSLVYRTRQTLQRMATQETEVVQPC